MRTFKAYALSLLFGIALLAQQTFPTITTYTLTEKDCDPLSMIMLFRPQGFVCKPSVNVVIAGMGPEVTGYDAEIVLQHGKEDPITFRVFIAAVSGEAHWNIAGSDYKVLRVTAAPQGATQPPTTVIF